MTLAERYRAEKRRRATIASMESEPDEDLPVKIKSKDTKTKIEDLVSQAVNKILSSTTTTNSYMPGTVAKSDIVPIFDPEKSDITASTWLHKIEQLAVIHGWNETTKSYYMQSKLQGVAKIWYNSLRDYNKTWIEWKSAVMEAFPSHEYFIDNLKKMMERKKTPTETMMHYYYAKCILVQKCEISDNNAVPCIIDGLPQSMQDSAKSGNYRTPEELFQGFLSKVESSTKDRTSNQLSTELCHICKKPGHRAIRCWFRQENSKHTPPRTSDRPPIRKCSNCGRNGHVRDNCWFSKTATIKTLQRHWKPNKCGNRKSSRSSKN